MAREYEAPPNCTEQMEGLLRHHPQRSFVRHCSRSILLWHANLRPSPLSGNYLIELNHHLGSPPDVRVLAPDLRRYQGRPLPHVYPGNRLCLFYPAAEPREWTPTMWLHETIVPWTPQWLLFYEIWSVTGNWFGGGIHPD